MAPKLLKKFNGQKSMKLALFLRSLVVVFSTKFFFKKEGRNSLELEEESDPTKIQILQ